MRRKKRQFHCNACGSPCETYRKGKKHRVLVCPHCGVIATNPSATGLLKGVNKLVTKVTRDIPAELTGLDILKRIPSVSDEPTAEDLNTSPSLPSPRRSPRRSTGDRLLKLIQAERLLGR